MKRHSVWRKKIRRVSGISEIRSSVEEVEPAVVHAELPHLEGPVRPHEELAAATHLLEPSLLAPFVLKPDLKKNASHCCQCDKRDTESNGDIN